MVEIILLQELKIFSFYFAKQIFKGDKTYSGLDLDLDDFEVEAVENNYFLQPTGGFEDFTAPVLSHLLIGNNPGGKNMLKS